MFQKILVALDDSDMSHQVYENALAIAQTLGAQLMLVKVLSPLDDGFAEYPIGLEGFHPGLLEEAMSRHIVNLGKLEEASLDRLKQWVDQGTQQGISVQSTQMMGNPGSQICSLAQSWNADLILLGRRGRAGLSEWILGSVSNYVLHHAPCSVLTLQGITPDATVAANKPTATTQPVHESRP